MEIRIVKSSDVAACPKQSMLPRHYRDDGTCRCDEHEAAQAAVDDANVEAARARAAVTAAHEWLSST